MTTNDLKLTQTALGNANPTLSFNLGPAKDFTVGMQYIDLMNSMRPWLGHREKAWGGMEIDDLRDGGYLDEDGWPTAIPEGMAKVGTVFGWSDDSAVADQQAGRYVIQYEGEGELQISGDVNVISQKPGEIIVDNLNGDKWFLDIIETDPAGNGNYIRNISVVAEEHQALHEAGALFNPDWLALIEDSRELRFMDWMATNGPDVFRWDDMPSPDGPRVTDMRPIEHMVQLANETGTDPWFTMPHLADEEFIRNFAEYVRDNLDPALTVRVEFSNEVWNWSFPQTTWARDQSVEEWGVKAHRDYYVKKSVETALIWEDVFGEEGADRLINVIGTQTGNPWFAAQLFDPKVWRENEPDSYVDPATVFEELAVTTYFGSNVVKEGQREGLLDAIKDPAVDANAYLYDMMMDPDVKRSIPEIAKLLAENAAVAAENGVKLVAYEGGQHIHQQIRGNDVSDADKKLISDFLSDFVRSDEMAKLYQEMWDIWAKVSDGAFMQFAETGESSQWGTWGLYEGPGDVNPRAELLEELNATTSPWWDGAEGGSHYQQGKIADGTAGADTLLGTTQEDYLLGGEGDDLLVGGKGNDGLHGGAGLDRALFSGTATDYTVAVEGDGYRVTGPDGSDFLIGVETLLFEDETHYVLADQPLDSDGTTVLLTVEGTQPNGGGTDGGGTDGGTDGGGTGGGTDGGGTDGGTDGGGTDGGTDGGGTDGGTDGGNKVERNIITGDEGDDTVYGGDNSDELWGNGGDDLMYAGDGDDWLFGGADDDAMHGGEGDDILNGSNGNDVIYGNAGNDRAIGGQGNDTLFGNSGDDRLEGHSGDDYIRGGSGNDSIFAGGGSDIINGGSGNDEIRGGNGQDEFIFSKGDGIDTIHDFSADDILTLNGYFDGSTLAVEDRVSTTGSAVIVTNCVDTITISTSDSDAVYQYVYDLIV